MSDSERSALDAKVLAWMREPATIEWPHDEERFDRLALELFAFQFEHCAPYGRFCARRGRTPATVQNWRDVPPVPSGAFKELALRSFAAEATVHVFRTSGTSAPRRGELHLDTLALYEASVVPSFVVHVLPELVLRQPPDAARPRLRVLAPAPLVAPDSSLSHMFGVLLRELASQGAIGPSGFDVAWGELRFEGWLRALEDAMAHHAPLVLCGTAFAFVHALDELARRGARLSLPAGSRVMETGGFKGRARELSRQALYALIEERLSIPPARIVNQYGMTELASQFHDSVLRFPGAARRKLAPPWVRVRLVDPATGDQVLPGEVGVVVIHDLGNTGSVCAVETADLARAVADGFEVIGREPGAEARGCSLAADEMLTGLGPA
ncbi:MAG TPA: hypothetical protein VKM54_13510 [Myxococcota bacterium]|nr:hypothetical protein [Myxococcota bacterium]